MRVAVLAVGIAIAAAVACGQAPGTTQRRGGLLPSKPIESPGVSSTRDELARRWDLNADGQIDEAEAETARSRMRRERLELLQRGQTSRAKPLSKPAEEEIPAEDLVLPDPAPSTAEKKKAKDKTATEPAKPMISAARQPAPPPKKDLNAGRLPAGLPPARGIPPNAIPPGRTGTGRAARPTPSFPSRPRISAEEIGGP